MKLSKIICLPDLLRGTRAFPEGFFDLVREPIWQACGIKIGYPPAEKRKLDDWCTEFDLDRFRALAGMDMHSAEGATQHELWQSAFYRLTDEAVDYLFSHLPPGALILSFEMPPWLASACLARGFSFVDIRPSPLRFGRDLYIGLRCSDPELFRRIAKRTVANEEIRLEAALLAANVRMHQRRLEESERYRLEDLSDGLLFVGQAPYDASLISSDGRSLRCSDFADQLKQLSQGRRLLHKPHPFALEFAREEGEKLRQITGKKVETCQSNAYQILSSSDDLELVGISSGMLQEASYFDKTAHILFQSFVPLANSDEPSVSEYQQIHFRDFLAPAFWHEVLTPERAVPRIAALPVLAHNHARETLDQWWDYSKVMTWERALPYESFMRGGGAGLRQRIEALEQAQSAGNAVIPTAPDTQRWKNLDPRHLAEQSDLAQAADLFRRSVKMVELEIFSYCNRRCWFCPNSSIDRISGNTFMPEEMYTSVLRQLASIDYDGMLTYSRYNEPLADKIILERMAQARKALPRALLHTNTNGDYLDREYIEQLYEAGLRSINIQIYLKNNERYDHEKIKVAGEKTLKRVGLPSTLVRDAHGEWYERKLHYRDMSIRLYGRNFETGGTSRGGQVPIHMEYTRTSPCLIPFWAVYIDHDGSTVPCCNFRSDVPAHKDYVIGNLKTEPNLFRQYASRFAANFRTSLIENGVKGGLCRNCHYAEERPTSAQSAQLMQLLKEARP